MVAGVAPAVDLRGVSFALNDPRGTLGTDTGGKLATLHMMERTEASIPTSATGPPKHDPTGVLHPLHYTYRMGGKWVNVTTLPMLYAAYPLYLVGGDRAVLLLPMLGAVLCAFAARALARRLGGGDGWAAFWIIGLASPVAIYALDFWEHTIGLALMLWGVVLLLDVLDRRAGWRGALGRRRLVRCCRDDAHRGARLSWSSRPASSAWRCSCGNGDWGDRSAWGCDRSQVPPYRSLANRLLEQWTIGTDVRGTRWRGTASSAGAAPSGRIREALTTAVGTGFSGLTKSGEIVVGVIVVACVAGGAWCLGAATGGAPHSAPCCSRRRGRVPALGLAGWGSFPACSLHRPSPPSDCASRGRRRELRLPARDRMPRVADRVVRAVSGRCRPAVGRPVHLSRPARCSRSPDAWRCRDVGRALVAVVTLAAVTTLAGVAWLSVRSNTVADGMTTILARHDEMLISRQPHMLRRGRCVLRRQREVVERDRRRAGCGTRSPLPVTPACTSSRSSVDPIRPPRGRSAATGVGGRELVSFIRPDVKLSVTTYRTQ